MTLATTTEPSSIAIQNVAGNHFADMVKMIGTVVDFSLPGVKNDVENWLRWTLGGKRYELTKRATFANGDNAYVTTQDAVCAVLGRLVETLDWGNPAHFWLIERATRPLAQTARHPEDVEFWKKKLSGATPA